MTNPAAPLVRFREPGNRGQPAASRLPGARPGLLMVISLLALWSFWHLDLGPRSLLGSRANLQLMGEFLARALSPALDYQGPDLPEGLPPLPVRAIVAAGHTVVFAAAAMSLAVPLSLLLGFFGCSAWWSPDPAGLNPGGRRILSRAARPVISASIRILVAIMRSVHELLWAVLLLAAFGLINATAVIALAIPFVGVLSRIFAEILDETPRETAAALRGAGASAPQVFLLALFPAALPDLAAYTFYRFECALRSSAVLGFFGFPTLGFFIAASFENLYYGEVWTYLYALFLLIVAVEWWSGVIRRRLVT